MILGVVGSEGAKFTKITGYLARQAIREAYTRLKPSKVVSGGCHLGGIDIWAIQIAKKMGIPTEEFIPTRLCWSGPGGYADRNLKIAASDYVICVTVKVLPESYKSEWRFETCYHCGDREPRHIKSGGCWTRWRCKAGELIIIE